MVLVLIMKNRYYVRDTKETEFIEQIILRVPLFVLDEMSLKQWCVMCLDSHTYITHIIIKLT